MSFALVLSFATFVLHCIFHTTGTRFCVGCVYLGEEFLFLFLFFEIEARFGGGLDNEVRFEIWYGFLGLENWLGRWLGLSCLVFFGRFLGGDVEFW